MTLGQQMKTAKWEYCHSLCNPSKGAVTKKISVGTYVSRSPVEQCGISDDLATIRSSVNRISGILLYVQKSIAFDYKHVQGEVNVMNL